MTTEKLSTVLPADSARQPFALWEIEDVARFLNVSIPTVRRHIKINGLPFKRVGRRMLFRPEEVNQWVEDQQTDRAA